MKHPLASLFAGRVLSKAVAGATLVGLTTAVPGVYAQETSATVRGAVSTSSGEALAGATVIVTSNATGVSKAVTTDEGGYYSVRGLPAGVSYDIVVDANGWQKASTAGLSRAGGRSEGGFRGLWGRESVAENPLQKAPEEGFEGGDL